MSQLGLRRLGIMLESRFQASLIKEIKSRFKGSVVLKNDPNYIQGIPDLVVFYKDKYAFLEVKKGKNASHRPNQDYYINKFHKQGAYSEFVFPENKEDVINGMARSFGVTRSSRIS